MKQTFRLLLIAIATLLPGFVRDASGMAERNLGPEYDQLSLNVATPHFPWAQKYERGALRMFSIGQTGQQRDALELAQRFPVAIEYLYTEPFGFGYRPGDSIANIKGTGETDRLKKFREIIDKNLDVIVPDGQFLFEVFPDEVTYRILDKVRNGAGLVIFTHYPRTGDGAPVAYTQRRTEIDRILYRKGRAVEDGDHFLSAGVPFRGLTAWAGIPDTKAFEAKMIRREFGKGRILILTDLFPPTGSSKPERFTAPNTYDGEYAEYGEREYYYAFAMKALLWAARKEPHLLLGEFLLCDRQGSSIAAVSTDTAADSRMMLTVQGEVTPGTTVQWHIRDRRGTELSRTVSPVKDRKAFLNLPELGRGTYYVDVVVWKGDTTITWGTTMLEVAGTAKIAGLDADRASLTPGDSIKVKISLSGPMDTGMQLRLSATGNFERLLAQENINLPVPTQEYTWTYRHTDALGRMLRVTAELFRNQRLMDTRDLEIPVRLPVARDQFQTMIWTNVSDAAPAYTLAWHLATNLHFDYLCVGYQSYNPIVRGTDKAVDRTARAGSRLNLGQWAYITAHQPLRQDNNVRTPCLTDPVFQAKEKERLLSFARTLKNYGVMYFLGDENTLQTPGNDLCFSPTCQADFREYLRGIYGSIDAVNRSWGTTFATWEEVSPLDLQAARRTNQPARWVDHQLHMSRVWTDIFRRSQDWLRETDPGAFVGLDYTCPEHGNFGEIPMSRTLSVLAPEPNQIMGEATRSLDLPSLVKGSFELWGFHAERGPGEEHKIWDCLLRGSSLCAMFGAQPGDGSSYLAPDLRPYSYFVSDIHETEVIKGGLDKLILPLRDQVAVGMVFSEAAQFAGQFHQNYYNHRSSYLALRRFLWENGVNFHLIPAEDLTRPEAVSGYRMIVLPACLALSTGQADTLGDFVRRGGILLADVRPATFDEHGRPLPAGLLDDLFGVNGPSGKRTVVRSPARIRFRETSYQLTDTLVDTGLTVTTGQAAGTAGNLPVVISRSFGAGRTMLLNLSMEFSFNGNDAPAGRYLTKQLLEESGVYLPVSSGRANYYRDGTSEYVVVCSRKSEPCRVSFRAPGHLYDGRSSTYLGYCRETVVNLAAGRGRWVSNLPYRVTGLPVRGPDSVQQGEPWVMDAEIRTAQGNVGGRHVVFVQITGPDGNEYRHYRQKVETASGKARITVPLCLNDGAGTWRAVVTDAATGVKGTCSVRVRKGGRQ